MSRRAAAKARVVQRPDESHQVVRVGQGGGQPLGRHEAQLESRRQQAATDRHDVRLEVSVRRHHDHGIRHGSSRSTVRVVGTEADIEKTVAHYEVVDTFTPG